MQKNFIRNTIKCNCTPAKIRYNVLLRTRLPQHSTDTDNRDSTATSAPHLISIQKPKMFLATSNFISAVLEDISFGQASILIQMP